MYVILFEEYGEERRILACAATLGSVKAFVREREGTILPGEAREPDPGTGHMVYPGGDFGYVIEKHTLYSRPDLDDRGEMAVLPGLSRPDKSSMGEQMAVKSVKAGTHSKEHAASAAASCSQQLCHIH